MVSLARLNWVPSLSLSLSEDPFWKTTGYRKYFHRTIVFLVNLVRSNTGKKLNNWRASLSFPQRPFRSILVNWITTNGDTLCFITEFPPKITCDFTGEEVHILNSFLREVYIAERVVICLKSKLLYSNLSAKRCNFYFVSGLSRVTRRTKLASRNNCWGMKPTL